MKQNSLEASGTSTFPCSPRRMERLDTSRVALSGFAMGSWVSPRLSGLLLHLPACHLSESVTPPGLGTGDRDRPPAHADRRVCKLRCAGWGQGPRPREVPLVASSGSHGPFFGEGAGSRGASWGCRSCWGPPAQTPASGAPAPQTPAFKNIIPGDSGDCLQDGAETGARNRPKSLKKHLQGHEEAQTANKTRSDPGG